MKLAVIGSRNFNNYELLKIELTKLSLSNSIEIIISGGAKGTDTLAEKYAVENSIQTMIYKPEYNLYGKAAPIRRNETIIRDADTIIAFWDGTSKGTLSAITVAKKYTDKRCIVIRY